MAAKRSERRTASTHGVAPRMAAISNIKNSGKNKDDKPKKGEKLPPAVYYRAVMDAINRDPCPLNLLPDFPHKLHLIEPEPGAKIPAVVDDGEVVTHVSEKHIRNLIMQYTQRELRGLLNYQFDAKQGKAAYDYWESSTISGELPAMFRWKDEPGLTYRRLPWAQETGETPLWDELVGRMGAQGGAFMAWVGSLFDMESDRQQYIWLYGLGSNSKGTVIRFLEYVMGGAYRSENAPDNRRGVSQFWTRNFLGARLVCFADCNEVGFPATGLFKSMTGGDSIRMEIKQGAIFHARLMCKILFASNEKPALSSEAADIRRAIFISIEPIGLAPDPTYEPRLWEEGGRFLSNCIEFYHSTYPNHGPLKVDNTELINHIDTIEEEESAFIEKHFKVHPVDKINPRRDQPHTTGKDMIALFDRERIEKHMRSKIRRYLEVKHGIINKSVEYAPGQFGMRYVRLGPKE